MTTISLCPGVAVRAPSSANEYKSEKKDTGVCFSLFRRIMLLLFTPALLVLWDSEEKNRRDEKGEIRQRAEGIPAGWQAANEMESRKFWKRQSPERRNPES